MKNIKNSEHVQRASAIYRMSLNLVQIIGCAALAIYLITKFNDLVVVIVAAGIATYGFLKLVKTAYLAELKVAPRK
ncbi:MAG: hypothetical protein E6R04_09835 [Spirochaetes bacterium]|nr:MAG: hypothetical protein E6R04_09835 [Spirochaetota bacterium]